MELITLLIQVLLCAVIGFFLSTTVHELGHVCCGLLHGWKLYLLVVGPLKIYRETPDSEIRFGIEKNVMMWGGMGSTLPPVKAEKNLQTFSKVLLAGPLSSLFFGILMGIVFLFWHNPLTLMLFLMPLAQGMMNLIPMKLKTAGFYYNDGTRYRRIKNGGQNALEEKALFMLIEHTLFENHETEYPAEMISIFLSSEDCGLNYYGYYFSYQNASLHHNDAEMQQQRSNMERIRENVPPIVLNGCPLDA